MSGALHPAYRFATEAQWQACHFLGADRRTAEARKGVRPFAPFGIPPASLWTGAAWAPAMTQDSELLWRDGESGLFRLPYAEDVAKRWAAPAALVSARRIVPVPGALWVVGTDGSLQAFETESFVPLFEADLGGVEGIDVASDSSDGVYVLGQAGEQSHIIHFGCAGSRDHSIVLEEPKDASELTFLGVPKMLLVLGSGKSKLYFIDPWSGRTTNAVPLSTLRACFEIDAIGGDGCSRFFIAGTDEKSARKGHYVLIVDQDGNLLGTLPIADRVTGIAATRSQLIVTTEKGIFRFDPAKEVPRGAGEIQALAVTPLLESPATGPQQWVRAEATVDLPVGCSLQIVHASVTDPKARAEAELVLKDRSLPPAQRLAQWRGQVGRRTFTYRGDRINKGQVVLSAPLHDVRDQSIWIEIVLIAAPGGRLPVISELKVSYPGPTLIEHLPAIYRNGELETADFTRAVVGVLEAGVQNLDEEIGKLGRNIHPDTADNDWLDYVASWLGLPWDNALGLEQKRRIVSRGRAIADGYSTRSGLEELLECLVSGQPRRFRVVDVSAEYGLATIAGPGCEGSRLPTVLGGLPATATELDNKAVLGRARLPCAEDEPDCSSLIGNIRIDIAANAQEREAWSPWLKVLVDQMLPATARAELRWLGPAGLTSGQIDEDFELVDEPAARVGSDAVTGASRLGGQARRTLPNKLTPDSTLQ